MKLEKISFCKVEDLVVVDEAIWEELIKCALDAFPDLKGKIGYDDPDFTDKVMGLLELMYGQTVGSA